MKKFILLVVLNSSLWATAELPQGLTPELNYEFTPLKKIELVRYGLINPKQIVVDESYIYMTDDFTNTLYKFDLEGELVTKIDQINGQRFSPGGLAVDYDYLILADKEKGCLYKFAKRMDLQQAYQITVNNQELYFSEPQGVCLDVHRDIYVADAGQDALVKVNMLGEVEWKIGHFGSTKETLNDPLDIAVDKQLNVYVTDANKKLKVFDQEGNLQKIFKINDPKGVFADNLSGDILYVAEFTEQRVAIFKKMKFFKEINDYLGESFTPQDVYYADQKLYILDPVQKTILVYAVN